MHTEVKVPHSVLMSVESPGRYVGGEKNQIIKPITVPGHGKDGLLLPRYL